jgi:hypothetical protein
VLTWNGSQWEPASDANAGTITEVTAGAGLSGGGSSGAVTLDVDPAAVQNRISGSCGENQSIRSVNQDGSVECETDSVGITGYEWVRAEESVLLAVNQCGNVRVECPTDKKLLSVWPGSSSSTLILTTGSTGIRGGIAPRPPSSYTATFCNLCRPGVQVNCAILPQLGSIRLEAICVDE